MKKIIIIERGQMTAKARRSLEGQNYAVVEVKQMDKVRVATVGELDIDRDMVVMSLFEAMDRSESALVRSFFTEAMSRRLKLAEKAREISK